MEGDGANRDGGRTSNDVANTQSDFLVSGLQAPAPLRPDLIGAFDATAHDSSLFDFSLKNLKTRSPMCQKTIWRVQQKINKIGQPGPVVAPPPIFLAPVPANWVPNPYKRIKMLDANGQERIEDGADDVPQYQDTPNTLESLESLEKSLFGAKASLRNHLKTHPAATSRPALKRRADGIRQPRWTRVHENIEDVKYLLTFPGETNAARAHDLLIKRNMISLDPVEEDSNESTVMPADPVPEPAHVSEASRKAKLDDAKNTIDRHTKNAPLMQSLLLQAHKETPAEAPADANSAEAAKSAAEPIATPKPGRCFRAPSYYSDTTTSGDTGKVDDGADNGADDTIHATNKEASIADPPSQSPAAPQPESPHTPSKKTTARDIVDVDLNEHPDIFASAVLQDRHPHISPEAPTQPMFVFSGNSPATLSSPNQTFDFDASALWSPLAATPKLTTGAADVSVPADPDQPIPTVESSLKQPKVNVGAVSVDALADLVGPIREMPGARVVSFNEGGRFIVRFKLPEQYAEAFAEEDFDHHKSYQEPCMAGSDYGTTDAGRVCEDRHLKIDPDKERVTRPGVEEEHAQPDAEMMAPAQDDERDYLLQFMSKHQAGKAKPTAASLEPELPAGSPNSALSSAPASVPARSPRTPETAAPRMWVETPTFTVNTEQHVQTTPIRTSSSQTRARTPLGQLDRNSPSPVKAKAGKRKLENGPEMNPDDKDAKPDEEPAIQPSPKRRRGLRARKPVAPPTPIPAPTSRMVRNGEKDLASLTRANTRANKGSSVPPEAVLATYAADPQGQKWKERKEVIDAKAARASSVPTNAKAAAAAKNVRWAKTLTEYEGGTIAEEDQQQQKRKNDDSDVDAAPPAPSTEEKASKKHRSGITRPQQSKLPAPVARTRRAAAAAPSSATPSGTGADVVAKPRATRAAAQKSNLSMGLSATGTPIRKGRAKKGTK